MSNTLVTRVIGPEKPPYNPQASLDVRRGLVSMRALGPRVKLGNGDIAHNARMRADGSVDYVPIMDMEVHMYFDDPGVYYDSHGRVLPDAVAAKAGFNVKREAAKRIKVMAQREVMAELADVAAERSRDIIENRGGYQLVAIDDTMFTVSDGEHDLMAPNVEQAARVLFNELAGPADEGALVFPSKGDKNVDLPA